MHTKTQTSHLSKCALLLFGGKSFTCFGYWYPCLESKGHLGLLKFLPETSVMAHQVKPLLEMLTCHMGVSSFPGALLLAELPNNVSGKAA